MAIITDESTRYPIPHEPDQWVMLKKLTGSQMDEADQVNTASVMKRLAPVMKELDQVQAQAQADAQDKTDIKVRRAGYDPNTLIKYAVTGWSYPEEPDDNPADMLDAITRDWLWDTIIMENTRAPESSPGGEPSSS